MGFTEVMNALKENQKWFRNAFACLFPECQLKACVCGWHLEHVGACLVREHWLRWGSLSACDCLGVAAVGQWPRLPWQTFPWQPVRQQLCMPDSAGRISSPFLNLLMSTLHIQLVQLKSQGADLGKERVQGILGKTWGMFCWQTLMCPLSFPLLF